jgi:protein SCO1
MSRPAFWLVTLAILPLCAEGADTALPTIGPAPAFELTAEDGHTVALADLRGKVVVVDFIFTSCTDECPLQTEKLASLQAALDGDFGPRVHFVSISIDPEHDTPEVLAAYAARHHARLAGWSFLTGRPELIRQISRDYGVVSLRADRGKPSHNPLTSVIDAAGALRVQYAGVRYQPRELLGDIRSLLLEREGSR